MVHRFFFVRSGSLVTGYGLLSFRHKYDIDIPLAQHSIIIINSNVVSEYGHNLHPGNTRSGDVILIPHTPSLNDLST